jgi:hypothetical protein
MIVRLFLVIVAVALALSAPAVSVSVDVDSVAEIETSPTADLDEVQPAVASAFRAPQRQPVQRVARVERAPATPQGARVFRPPRVTFDRV